MAVGPVATSLTLPPTTDVTANKTADALDASSTPSWGLEPVCAARTQGLVVSPFADLASGEALHLCLPDGCGGAWLSALRGVVPITAANGPRPTSAAIAFTWSGLRAMRLDDAALASFADPFREGMRQADRRRRLSDEGEAVVREGVVWSGGTEDDGKAPITVHVLLLLYAATDAALDQVCAEAQAVLDAQRVQIVRRTRLSLRLDANGISREHFGFADGVSQPLPYGPEIRKGGSQAPRSAWHAVAPGDILLGHENAHGELAPGPLVKAKAGAVSPLAPSLTAEGFDDLGLNGSYLVVRELRQDVAAFWTSMDAAASSIGDAGLDAATFAARVIGRTQDGAPLTPGGARPPSGGQPANDFGYIGPDQHGFGCPLGAHIRRANPRDGLAQDLEGGPGLLKAANNHRILRRGRKFGPDIADPRVDDGVERGLLFMCLNTDLVRQFEFVQQNWLLNPGFAVLFDETDPLLGPKGSFTLPGHPLRRRATIDTFVRFAGGDYFFLPSLPALDYLQTLS